MGPASTGIAALQLSYRFVDIEKSAHYFNMACRRIEREVAGGLFTEPAQAELV